MQTLLGRVWHRKLCPLRRARLWLLFPLSWWLGLVPWADLTPEPFPHSLHLPSLHLPQNKTGTFRHVGPLSFRATAVDLYISPCPFNLNLFLLLAPIQESCIPADLGSLGITQSHHEQLQTQVPSPHPMGLKWCWHCVVTVCRKDHSGVSSPCLLILSRLHAKIVFTPSFASLSFSSFPSIKLVLSLRKFTGWRDACWLQGLQRGKKETGTAQRQPRQHGKYSHYMVFYFIIFMLLVASGPSRLKGHTLLVELVRKGFILYRFSPLWTSLMVGSQFHTQGGVWASEVFFFKLPGHSNVHPTLRTTILEDRDLQSLTLWERQQKETGDI